MRSSLPTSTRRFCTEDLDRAVGDDVSAFPGAEFSGATALWGVLNSAIIPARRALNASFSGERVSAPSTARLVICRRASTD